MVGVSPPTVVLLLAVVYAGMVSAITVNVSGTASHPIPKTLCESEPLPGPPLASLTGLMFGNRGADV